MDSATWPIDVLVLVLAVAAWVAAYRTARSAHGLRVGSLLDSGVLPSARQLSGRRPSYQQVLVRALEAVGVGFVLAAIFVLARRLWHVV